MQGWCAYQERSQHDARQKLYELGLWQDVVENIIVQLIQDNFLNEERFATQFAKGKFNIKRWGRIKIKQELKQKRISDYCLKKALQQIDGDEYLIALKTIIEKKRKTSAEKNPFKLKQKLYAYAASKGYESDLIMDVLKGFDE